MLDKYFRIGYGTSINLTLSNDYLLYDAYLVIWALPPSMASAETSTRSSRHWMILSQKHLLKSSEWPCDKCHGGVVTIFCSFYWCCSVANEYEHTLQWPMASGTHLSCSSLYRPIFATRCSFHYSYSCMIAFRISERLYGPHTHLSSNITEHRQRRNTINILNPASSIQQ